jgi:hypothetical protein
MSTRAATALDGNKTVWEEISGGNDIIKLGKHEMNSRAYCSTFNFKGGDQQQKVGTLSGGQRNRVHLAKLLKSGGNVLLLDEPTNDLDTETLGRWKRRWRTSPAAPWSSARPHVPRPPRHPHPRLRGRQPCRMVRGQLRGLRAGQDPPFWVPESVNPKRVTYKRSPIFPMTFRGRQSWAVAWNSATGQRFIPLFPAMVALKDT